MSKRKVYFDNNIYADIIRLGISVDLIKEILSRNNLVLTVSSLNLFEAASCWKSGDSKAINQGVKRFQLFRELLPCSFLEEIPTILKGEITKALYQQSIEVFYSGVEAEKEINKLANGIYDETARTFIENTWASKSKQIQQKTEYLNQIHETDIPVSFEEFHSRYKHPFAELLIEERVKGIPPKDKRKLALKMLQKLQKFPLFNNTIKANLFLDFRLLKFKSISHDTLDDLKHLMYASYADIFVSNDEKLHKYFFNINVQLKMLKLSELVKL